MTGGGAVGGCATADARIDRPAAVCVRLGNTCIGGSRERRRVASPLRFLGDRLRRMLRLGFDCCDAPRDLVRRLGQARPAQEGCQCDAAKGGLAEDRANPVHAVKLYRTPNEAAIGPKQRKYGEIVDLWAVYWAINKSAMARAANRMLTQPFSVKKARFTRERSLARTTDCSMASRTPVNARPVQYAAPA